MMQASDVIQLIARQRSGWSLEQPFYLSEDVYAFERSGWLAEQWFMLAHCSELAEAGSFIVRELLGESLLIVRDGEGTVRGFYNVCRHRGSRICDEDGRATRGFVCPYHAWSYRLDGSLRTAAALPDDLDTTQLGLRSVPIREIGGVILGSLRGDPWALELVQKEFEPGLNYHGIAQARIAARRHYPTLANWKLVLENFRECYHCLPAHPEYSSVMQWTDAIARVPADGGAGWTLALAKWADEQANPESPVPVVASDGEYAAANARAKHQPTPAAGANRAMFRIPIGGDHQTQSQDGKPVAPLMGRQPRFDGGVSHFSLRPFVTVMALNDHAVMMQFLPTGAQSTDVTITWLVNASASVTDVDVERMVWLWDVTTIQDKRLIERNAAGVRSQAYVPGPYTKLESRTAQFIERYLREQPTSHE